MAQESKAKVYLLGDDPVIAFAGQELQTYWQRMAGGRAIVSVETRPVYDPQAEGLWLGTMDALRAGVGAGAQGWPQVADPRMDDAIAIAVHRGRGFLAGSNPRSVLLAVYRLLTEAGCRWVRPGAAGECIPQRDLGELSINVQERAAYRHRGICIEGAVSQENVTDIIAWAPKVGFNAYFIQFREAYTFYERWYTHRENPTKAPEPFSVERARECVAAAEREIARRGLLYHKVGHGWTCEPLGIAGLSWDAKDYTLSPEVRRYLAEVNGERAIWHGIPLNTNLCYSNPEVRRLVTEAIADYAQENPQVDILHFWLADGSNNQCECAACRQMIPADWYVMMLNELDALLTRRGLPVKIVFLIYVDLLWPPQVERIKNPERFILMFAPITRSYSTSFAASGATVSLPAYERNRLKFPSNVDENVAFLRAWQAIFQGDSFDFDYHLMWDHYYDPGYYAIAKLLNQDIKNLKQIGLGGLISCQVQRAFFPTGLPMVVMGRTLWDDTLSFDAIARDYFAGAFGPEGERAQEYLAQLSELFDPPYLRRERPQQDPEAAARFARIPDVVRAFQPVIARNLAQTTGCQAQSWRYLQIHGQMCTLLAQALAARARGEAEVSWAAWEQLKAYVQAQEDAIQPVFDVFEFIHTMERRLKS
jgi:hypothetical protein